MENQRNELQTKRAQLDRELSSLTVFCELSLVVLKVQALRAELNQKNIELQTKEQEFNLKACFRYFWF